MARDVDELATDLREMAAFAAQLRDDYAWLLVHCQRHGGHWDEALMVDDREVTRGALILEMARERFRLQSEEHRAAYDLMRALLPRWDDHAAEG